MAARWGAALLTQLVGVAGRRGQHTAERSVRKGYQP